MKELRDLLALHCQLVSVDEFRTSQACSGVYSQTEGSTGIIHFCDEQLDNPTVQCDEGLQKRDCPHTVQLPCPIVCHRNEL